MTVRVRGKAPGSGPVLYVAVPLTFATAACAASPESMAAEYFIECMADRGVTVVNVAVEVGDDRHIEVLDWDDQSSGTDSPGEACADETFDNFEISRT